MSTGQGGGGGLGGLWISLRADTSAYMRDMAAAERRADKTEDSLDRVDRSSRRLEQGFMAAAAGAAVLAAGLAALVNRYGKVDEVFAMIQANTQASDVVMTEMRDTVAELGAELPTTMAQGADALDELIRAGFTAEQAMGALEGTTYLAISGSLQMSEAAAITAAALNAWSLEAARANSIADVLASTAVSSSSSVRSLGDALSYAASTSAAVGASTEEVVAWAGILETAGIHGTRAGTAIRQALTRIIEPTDEAQSALSSVGLSVDDFYDRAGKLRDVEDILAMLNESMAGMTAHERSKLINQIFGLRGGEAIRPLIANSKEFSEILNTNLAASLAGAIDRIEDLNDTELKALRRAVGFKLERGSTESVLRQFREQAQKQDWSQAELATRLQEGLDVGHEAAMRLSVDLTGGTEISAIENTLEGAVTSGEQARAIMSTLTGRIEGVLGKFDAFFMNVYAGAAGPLMLMLDVVEPIAGYLADNKGAAQAFGVALVGLTAVLGTVAFLAGLAIARNYALAAAQYASEGAALASAAAQNALSASYWRTQGAAVASRGSSIGLTAARYAGMGAAYASAGAERVLTGAKNLSTGASIRSRAATAAETAWRWTARRAGMLYAGAEYALTAAKNSSTAATIRSTAMTGYNTAARYANRAAGFAAALGTGALTAASWASVPSLGAMATGLYAAAAGAWALMSPLLPFIALGALLVGVWYAWENNLWGVQGAVLGLLGPLGGLEGITAAVGGVFRWTADAAGWLITQVENIIGPLNATKAAMLAFPPLGIAMWLFDVAGGMNTVHRSAAALGGVVHALLNPIDTVTSFVGGLTSNLDAAHALMLAFPPLGIAAWLLELGTGFDVAGAAVDTLLSPARVAEDVLYALTHPVETLHDALTGLSSFSVADIPLVGETLTTGPAAAALHLLVDPVVDLYDALVGLSNLDVSDVPVIGGYLQQGINAGRGLARGFAKGARGKKGLIGKVTGGLMGVARKYLPGSDAERGPLSRLTAMGAALPATLARGVRANRGILGSAMGVLAGLVAGILPDRLAAPLVETPRTPAAPVPAMPTVPAIPAPAVERPVVPEPVRAAVSVLAAPFVGQPTAPTPIRGVAPPFDAPVVGRPMTPSPTVPQSEALPTPAVGRPAVPTPARPAVSIPAPTMTATTTVDAQTGRVPPESAFTPDESLTTRVAAWADTRSLRAEINTFSPVEIPARLVLVGDVRGSLATVRETLSEVSPLAGVVSQATRARSELEAGAFALFDRLTAGARSVTAQVTGLSLPGGDVTIGETVGTLSDRATGVFDGVTTTIEERTGIDLPDASALPVLVASVPGLPDLGVETPGRISVARPGMMGIEQPTDIGVNAPAPLAVEPSSMVGVEQPPQVGVETPGRIAVDAPDALGVSVGHLTTDRRSVERRVIERGLIRPPRESPMPTSGVAIDDLGPLSAMDAERIHERITHTERITPQTRPGPIAPPGPMGPPGPAEVVGPVGVAAGVAVPAAPMAPNAPAAPSAPADPVAPESSLTPQTPASEVPAPVPPAPDTPRVPATPDASVAPQRRERERTRARTQTQAPRIEVHQHNDFSGFGGAGGDGPTEGEIKTMLRQANDDLVAKLMKNFRDWARGDR